MRRAALGAAVALAALATGCASTPPADVAPAEEPMNPMEAILRSHPGLAAVVDEAPKFRLQAVLGLVEAGEDGRPVLVQHGFRLGAEYFYPASTVKLFAAVAALERLHELADETGHPVRPETPLVYHPLFDDEELEDADPENLDGGTITVLQELRRIFLVSDNRAFNRLYELVGQDRLAASMRRAGLDGAWIVHRLSELRSPEENRHFPRIDLAGGAFRIELPERTSQPLQAPDMLPGLLAGRGYYDGDTLVEEPFDFSVKNQVPLAELQKGLCMVVRPEVDCGGPGFELTERDRELVLEAMRQFPRESPNPRYDPAEYPDAYVKPTLPGVRRVIGAENARVLDKTGEAYGFSIENAWVVDESTGRGFFLAATLYTNADGILNDDAYEYATVAAPFLADLGEAAARWVWEGGSSSSD